MYRFVDRPVRKLDPASRLLIGAMREWVMAVQTRTCPCARISGAFEAHAPGQGRLAGDFGMAMATLHCEARRTVRLSAPRCARVNEDEAILLALFHAGPLGRSAVRRVAEPMVAEAGLDTLALAVERVAPLFDPVRPLTGDCFK